MRLENMYTNVLSLSLEALTLKVEIDSERRSAMIAESMQKIDIGDKKSVARLTDSEKAILKALGLSAKDIKALREAT